MRYFPIALIILYFFIVLEIFFNDIPFFEVEGEVFMIMLMILTFVSFFNKSSRYKSLIVLLLMTLSYFPFVSRYDSLLQENIQKYQQIVVTYEVDKKLKAHGSLPIKSGFLKLDIFYRYNENSKCMHFFGRPFKDQKVCDRHVGWAERFLWNPTWPWFGLLGYWCENDDSGYSDIGMKKYIKVFWKW